MILPMECDLASWGCGDGAASSVSIPTDSRRASSILGAPEVFNAAARSSLVLGIETPVFPKRCTVAPSIDRARFGNSVAVIGADRAPNLSHTQQSTEAPPTEAKCFWRSIPPSSIILSTGVTEISDVAGGVRPRHPRGQRRWTLSEISTRHFALSRSLRSWRPQRI